MGEAHEKRIEIRSRDTDQYGHVNNAVYLTYLEEARDEWLARAADVAGFILARVAIDYRREVTQADGEVVVRCRLAGLGTSSVRTLEQILTPDGAVAAEAEAVLVARDPGSGRSRPLTDPERTAIGA